MVDTTYFPVLDGSEAPPSYTQISEFLGIAINVMMGIAFGLGFISVAVSLVKLILSQGDPKATQGAFNGIKWGIIAIVISLGVIVIKSVVVNLIGVTGMDNATPDF